MQMHREVHTSLAGNLTLTSINIYSIMDTNRFYISTCQTLLFLLVLCLHLVQFAERGSRSSCVLGFIHIMDSIFKCCQQNSRASQAKSKTSLCDRGQMALLNTNNHVSSSHSTLLACHYDLIPGTNSNGFVRGTCYRCGWVGGLLYAWVSVFGLSASDICYACTNTYICVGPSVWHLESVCIRLFWLMGSHFL